MFGRHPESVEMRMPAIVSAMLHVVRQVRFGSDLEVTASLGLGARQGQRAVAAGGSFPACRLDRGAVVLSRQRVSSSPP